MFRFVLAIGLSLLLGALPSSAQMTTLQAGGFSHTAGSPGYSGPGDVVSGAFVWYGLRGYNAAYSGFATQLCTPADAACETESISSGNLVLGTVGLTCNNTTIVCTIRSLFDQSGGGNCTGVCTFDQPTIASRPTFIAAGAANGCPTTSFPCMNWATIQPDFSSFVTSAAITQPFTVSLVAQAEASGSLFHDGGNDVFVTGGTGPVFSLFAGTGYNGTAVTLAAWNAVQSVFNNTACTVDSNGTTQTAGTCGTGAISSGNVLRLGNDPFNGTFPGKVEEIGVWNGAFTGTQQTNMNANQRAYWGF